MISSDLHLKVDGIKEAICEIRFNAPQSPEVVLGRLADSRAWRDHEQKRLPAADLPAALREVDQNLRYQPILEVAAVSRRGFLRIGPYALSIHQTEKYEGWTTFQPAIKEAVDSIYEALPAASIERIGLRYINLLNEHDHLITKPHNLRLSIKTADNISVVDSFVVNYRRNKSPRHVCQVCVATPEYTAGPSPDNFSVAVDIDVFTTNFIQISNESDVMNWIEDAHLYLKEEFFDLWKDDVIQKLKRD